MTPFSPAWERNRGPILAVLQHWLPAPARVLEIGAGGGQHALFFCQQISGLNWQTSEHPAALADLQAQRAAVPAGSLAAGSLLPDPIGLDVTCGAQWSQAAAAGPFTAVFSANTCHIMPAAAVPALLAGAARVLRPGGLLLLYGPFHNGGVHTAASNAAFDAQLRSLDPAMGVRDALQITAEARRLGLAAQADIAMPANNRTLVFQRSG